MFIGNTSKIIDALEGIKTDISELKQDVHVVKDYVGILDSRGTKAGSAARKELYNSLQSVKTNVAEQKVTLTDTVKKTNKIGNFLFGTGFLGVITGGVLAFMQYIK
ncbi:MAG: hypothetical protein ACE5EE_10890 [Fidelibacterota bacterium]